MHFVRSKDELKTDCTYCGAELKLYLNFHKKLFYCFKCHRKGRIGQELIDKVRNLPPPRPKDPEPLPTGIIPIKDSPTGLKYLRNRNIEPRDGWFFCFEGEYFDRIVFPIYCFGKYFGFQARTIHPPEVQPIRYRSSHNLPLSRLLFNYDSLKYNETTYVTEGVFASTKFQTSVAAFTKRISVEQAKMLAVKTKKVVIAFDKDAMHEAIQGGFVLNMFGIVPNIMIMDKKGPDDHTDEELKNLRVKNLFECMELPYGKS